MIKITVDEIEFFVNRFMNGEVRVEI